MSTIVTRSGKGSPLTHVEVDANFTNLNSDKYQEGSAIGAVTPAAGTFTTLTAQTEVLKGTGQNLLTYSQLFTNSFWTKDGSTATASGVTAPDGSSTGQTLTESATTAEHRIYSAISVTTNTAFTWSIYAKPNGRNWIKIANAMSIRCANFNVSTGTVGTVSSGTTATITSVGNGWYRCSMSGVNSSSSPDYMTVNLADADAGTSNSYSYTGNGTSGAYLWGAQLEIGSVLNTYIPTTTTAVYGTPTLSFSGVAGIGLQSDGSLYETSAGTGNVRFYTNNIAQEQLRVSHTASAVNYVQVTGAATGGGVTVSAQGSDTNVSLVLRAKGSNEVSLGNGNTFRLFSAIGTSGTNYLQVTSSATTVAPVLSALGSDTNIPLVLQPKGTGALQAQQTDSTATGGNARGANAVDWQTIRDYNFRVASGAQSVLTGGIYNTASGQFSVTAGGYANTASGSATVVSGGYQNTNASTQSTLVGGYNNTVSSGSYFGFLGAGYGNTSAGALNVVVGGQTNSGTSGTAVTTQSGTSNGTTTVTLSGSNANIKVGQLVTGSYITFYPPTYVAAISGTTLTLSQNAAGSATFTLSFITPHGVVVGGGNNQATGSYSFIGGGGDAGTAANRNVASGDWSTVGGGQKNTASNTYSFVGGGESNTASAARSIVVGGQGNAASSTHAFVGGGAFQTASGTYSCIVGGYQHISSGDSSAVIGGVLGTTRSIAGNHVFAACNNPIGSGANGTNQGGVLILGRQTTDATATVLTSNSSAASTTNQVILPNNSAYYFKGTVVAGVTGGGNTKGWTVEGVIKRGANAASTAIVGTATVLSSYGDAGATTWALTATADTTNGGLAITFTGQAGTTIRVVAKIETTECTY